jgi:hypothetical protein
VDNTLLEDSKFDKLLKDFIKNRNLSQQQSRVVFDLLIDYPLFLILSLCFPSFLSSFVCVLSSSAVVDNYLMLLPPSSLEVGRKLLYTKLLIPKNWCTHHI